MKRLATIVGGGLLIAALLVTGAAGMPAGARSPAVWPQPSPGITPDPVFTGQPDETPKPDASSTTWTQPPSPSGTPPPGMYPCVHPPAYPQQPKECLDNWLWPEKKA